VMLDPYYNVLIMEQPDWQLQRTVTLTGEVRFPGTYALTSKNERFSNLTARAGGLTHEADADAAQFSRIRARTAFAAEFRSETRVGIDLARALRCNASDDNLLLIDDDSLHVPFRRTTVQIRGFVNAPTAVAIENGRSLRYYVRAASGASAQGAEKHKYDVEPKGHIEARQRIPWVLVSNPVPRAGVTAIVPVKTVKESRNERLATLGIPALTFASIAAVIAILR